MIALIDCNNFYVSCERVFNPKLINKPVIILSNNCGNVVARSDEVKKLGIKMSQPFFEIRDLIRKHDIKYFASNYTLYGDLSSRIMKLLEQFSNNVEVYSIDEAFIEVASNKSYEELRNFALNIKNTIFKSTGIPCSVGISYTKSLAKIANKISKKSEKAKGVLVLIEQKHIDTALAITKVSDIWGIGRQYSDKLNALNINFASEFIKQDEIWIKKNYTKLGVFIARELRSIPCIPLELIKQPKKSILVSRSFEKDKHQFEDLYNALARHVALACKKLRDEKLEAQYFSIFIISNRFKDNFYSNSISVRLSYYSSYTPYFLKLSKLALKKIYKENIAYKKCGILLYDLSTKSEIMSNIFDFRDIQKESALTNTIDKINNYYGRDAIIFASAKNDKQSIIDKIHVSKKYTKKWNDIIVAK